MRPWPPEHPGPGAPVASGRLLEQDGGHFLETLRRVRCDGGASPPFKMSLLLPINDTLVQFVSFCVKVYSGLRMLLESNGGFPEPYFFITNEF